MKHIYFIRHGETLKNLASIHQSPDEPLTDTGRGQVVDAVTFLRQQNIDTLISSDYLRARQTADIIGHALELRVAVDASVHEFRRPNELYGRHHFSPASFKYVFDLYRNRLNLLWDDDGAENLAHVRERIRDARLALEALPGERVAVVSHRIFMSMFAETVCYDQPLSLWKFVGALLGRQRIPNTGILYFTCESKPVDHACTWQLVDRHEPPYNEGLLSKE